MKTDLTVNGFVFKGNKVLLIYNPKYQMWLGVGGHIDSGMTPDEQLLKEVKEEVGLDVEILSTGQEIEVSDNALRSAALPFYADVHNVGDHNHYAQYYVCVPSNPSQEVVPDNREVAKYSWFTESEVEANQEIKKTTKAIVRVAFRFYRNRAKGSST